MARKMGLVCLLCAALLALGAAGTAWSADKPWIPKTVMANKTPITFTVTVNEWPAWSDPMTADPVGKYIIANTGVTLDVQVATGDYTEKLNLMIATGDYTDWIVWPGDQVLAKMKSEGTAVALDDLIDKYMPNVKTEFSSSTLGVHKSLEDGKLYYLPCFVIGEFYPSVGWLVRRDIMDKYFGNRPEAKAIFSMDEMYQVLKNQKAATPKVGGKDFLGLTGDKNTIWQSKYAFGMNADYWITPQNNLRMEYYDPLMTNYLKFYNKLYREGLLDPDIFINKQDEYNQKIATGQGIMSFGHFSTFEDANKVLKAAAPNDKNLLVYFRAVQAGVKDRYPAHSPYGGMGWVMTSKNRDKVRAAQFMNYLADPAINWMVLSGLAGDMWNPNEKGEAVLDAKKWASYTNLWDRFKATGTYKIFFQCLEGPDKRLGNLWPTLIGFLMNGGQDLSADTISKFRYQSWTPADLADPGVFVGITPTADSNEAIIQQQGMDLWDREMPNIIMAQTESEAMSRYQAILQKITAAGIADYEKVISANYRLRLKAMGKE